MGQKDGYLVKGRPHAFLEQQLLYSPLGSCVRCHPGSATGFREPQEAEGGWTSWQHPGKELAAHWASQGVRAQQPCRAATLPSPGLGEPHCVSVPLCRAVGMGQACQRAAHSGSSHIQGLAYCTRNWTQNKCVSAGTPHLSVSGTASGLNTTAGRHMLIVWQQRCCY